MTNDMVKLPTFDTFIMKRDLFVRRQQTVAEVHDEALE